MNLVDGTGTRRRIAALHAIGWTAVALAPELDMPTTSARQRVNQWRYARRVTTATHNTVAQAYDRLRDTPGPSHRARFLAARAGCLPPAAWDGHDIDDPNDAPDTADDEDHRAA